jgi:hypothetical protein
MELAKVALLLDESGGVSEDGRKRRIEAVEDADGIVFRNIAQFVFAELLHGRSGALPCTDPLAFLLLLFVGDRIHREKIPATVGLGHGKGGRGTAAGAGEGRGSRERQGIIG